MLILENQIEYCLKHQLSSANVVVPLQNKPSPILGYNIDYNGVLQPPTKELRKRSKSITSPTFIYATSNSKLVKNRSSLSSSPNQRNQLRGGLEEGDINLVKNWWKQGSKRNKNISFDNGFWQRKKERKKERQEIMYLEEGAQLLKK